MAESAGSTRAPISEPAARAWIDSWDVQQAAYLPERESRFTALIDALEEAAGRPDPLVLDLGCGPGSLAVRLLSRLPAATVVAIDADPLTLALGQAAFADLPGLSFVDADLRVPGWSAALDLPRQPDAAVSTTALHWLTEHALAALYAELAGLLRPGGLLLNGDHMTEDEDAAPTLARLTRSLAERAYQRHALPEQAQTWQGWWSAAAADPDLASLVAKRDERHVESEHHGSPAGQFSVQVAALRAAGFAEVGTLWQSGYNRVLCGVLPTG
jgi:trans-aconitate methyltransferase